MCVDLISDFDFYTVGSINLTLNTFPHSEAVGCRRQARTTHYSNPFEREHKVHPPAEWLVGASAAHPRVEEPGEIL